MFRILVPALALCLMAASVGAQQPQLDNITKSKNGDWTLECGTVPKSGARLCYMVQFSKVPQSPRPIVTAVLQPSKGKNPVFQVIAPLSVWLRPGVEISIDGGAKTNLGFEYCLRDGCYALMPMSQGFIDALKKGKAATLVLRSINRKSIGVKVSLSGFTKSLNGISG